MPFLTRSSEGERVLFFCQSDDQHIWKLFVSIDDDDPFRIETGFANDVIECSPSAWQDETGWHLSFIAGGATKNPIYHLYRMDGTTLKALSCPIAIRPAKSGFILFDRMVTGALQDVVNIHDSEGDMTIELPGAYIYRVSYQADKTDVLIITGQWIGENETFSITYNIKTSEQQLIECDGNIAYKPTIFDNEILYAERIGESFESRQIKKAKYAHHKKCHIASQRHIDDMGINLDRSNKCTCKSITSKNIDNASRQSCIECVEKHIGAAFVIASEIHDGYAYRLRLIGHLHEAEDESQVYTELHNLIRQSRKEYQKDNKIPDWELLAKKIADEKTA
jgi:hypothetical protein